MLAFLARRAGETGAILVDGRGRAVLPAQRLKASSVTIAAVIALTTATPTDNLGSLAPERDAAAAAVAGAADAIRKRSPGVRRIIGWLKGRPIYARPAVRAAPRIRRPAARATVPPVLPALLTPPPPATPLALAQDELAFGPVTIGPLPVYDLSEACDCAFVYLPPERGLGAIIIGGGGGGGVVPPVGPPVEPPIRPPAIPEAPSWALMIMGFAFIGTAWRRRRKIVHVLSDTLPLRLSYCGVRVPALVSPRAG